ncbi:unnamed protein product, partial [Mesorhabditis spiculigera]
MKCLLLFLGLFAVSAWATKSIPDEFLGKWAHEKDENFDEFLQKKGVGWLTRKLILFSSVTKVFAKDKKSNGYVMESLTSKKNVKYEGVQLGKEFTAAGMDSTKHKITFDFADGKLTEKHIRFESEGQPEETYAYYVKDGKLIMEMTNGDLVAKRYFKKA